MDARYIAAKLALLPQFEVDSVDHRTGKDGRITILNGYFSEPIGPGEHGANLFLPDLRSLDGSLQPAPRGGHLRSIEISPYSWGDISERTIRETTLAYFGNYDLRRMKLVLDKDIQWNQVEFRPQKAVQSSIIGTDGNTYRKLAEYQEGMPLSQGEAIVEGAWDHEHCVFCWGKIDSEHVGFASDEEWACEWCFKNAIEVHDPRPLLIPYDARRQYQKNKASTLSCGPYIFNLYLS